MSARRWGSEVHETGAASTIRSSSRRGRITVACPLGTAMQGRGSEAGSATERDSSISWPEGGRATWAGDMGLMSASAAARANLYIRKNVSRLSLSLLKTKADQPMRTRCGCRVGRRVGFGSEPWCKDARLPRLLFCRHNFLILSLVVRIVWCDGGRGRYAASPAGFALA